MKRFKWEPVALIILVVGLGVWLVWGSRDSIYGTPPAPGTRRVELRIDNSRGIVEVTPAPTAAGEPTFRVKLRDGFVSEPPLTAGEYKRFVGERRYAAAVQSAENPLFRLFNITSWVGMIWASVGLLGQIAFSGRMLVQWIVSERRRESVIPPVFWWLSLFGGLTLFAYFVWRQDIVGVLGQSSGVVIYSRNIRLIYKQRRRQERQVAINHTHPQTAAPVA